MAVFDEAIATVGLVRYDTGWIKRGTVAGILPEARDFAIRSIQNIVKSHGRLPRIHFDLVDEGSLNAGAFRYKDEFFIFINTGALGLFTLMFVRLLADPRFFRDIGNPEVERPHLPGLGAILPSALEMKDAFSRLETPLDKTRIDYSQGLILRAFGFLFAHELTHVLDGHLDLLVAKGKPFYLEFEQWDMSRENADRQALEMDADNGAVCAELHQLLLKVADHPSLDPATTNAKYMNPRQALFIWFSAVHTLFRFFGDTRFTPPELHASSYPPPRMRQLLITLTAERYLRTKSKRPDLADICQEVSTSALLAVETAFSALGGDPISMEGVKDAEAYTDKHASRITHHWRTEMRPKLLRFAYLPLPE